MSKVIDLTGKTFGKLTVLSRAENDKYGKAQWLCQCQCGNLNNIMKKMLLIRQETNMGN